ncbi:6-bladed beta-propeller [Bacteroides cellulosilyticus]|jgi:hypothetical protein|uniref:6-bladed beta-propeller n=2 Tax=Bacteroides TaxID=816 RepID=UPI0032C1A103
MKLKYLLLLLIVLVGCSNPSESVKQEVKVLNVPLLANENEVMMSTFVDSISYIPLETKDNCLIGNIDKIIATDDFYYIIDRNISCSVLCFDKSGRFVRKYGNRGVGAGEYIEITDVNVYKDKIYLWDCSLRKLFVFDHSNNLVREEHIDYMASTFSVLDDSWIAFFGNYKRNKKYSQNGLSPNLLFVNIDNKQMKSDLFFDSRIRSNGIVLSDFNFVSNGNLVTSLNDTVYQALPAAILKRKYVVQFGERYLKAQKDYLEKLKTEVIDVRQVDKFMKEIPYMHAFLETPSYSILRYGFGDYFYLGIVNHKESDTYIEASGFHKSSIINDMDGIAVFIPLASYKNAVYTYMSPEAIAFDMIPGKQIKPDDNPIIVKFELK